MPRIAAFAVGALNKLLELWDDGSLRGRRGRRLGRILRRNRELRIDCRLRWSNLGRWCIRLFSPRPFGFHDGPMPVFSWLHG